MTVLPDAGTVVDIGSGAGLPAVALALAAPGLQVAAVESVQRRVHFLERVAGELGLPNLEIVHGRAEGGTVRSAVSGSDVVTARAVAALDRLAALALPLLAPGGRLVAMKGERAQAEVDEHRRTIETLGFSDLTVSRCGSPAMTEPTIIVTALRAAGTGGRGRKHDC